jgi:hypothetical protein
VIEKLRAGLLAVVERMKSARTRSPRAGRIVLGIAFVLFLGATAIAVRNLPPLPAGRRQPALFAVIAVLAALAIVVNGAEYALSARALGGRVSLRDATRVSVLSTAANLLPVPGAAVVKTRALQRRGAKLRIAATLTIAIGVIWVGVAALVAGVLVATTGRDGVFAAVLTSIGVVVTIIGVVMLVTQKTQISNRVLVGTAFAIEVASVGLTGLRFYLVLRAIGFDGSLAQAATLAATAIIASAAGVFPSGLGLRELLSSAVGPAVGLSAAVSTVVAAVERVVSLAVVAVMALVIMLIDRGDTPVPEAQLSPAPEPETATCA